MQSFSLREFNELIKDVLSKNMENSYWIVAEIGEINVNQKGHCYLDLIEKEGDFIAAKNRAVIWSYTYSKLSNWFISMTGSPLKSGMKVLINAAVQYHEIYGFSLNIKDVDPNFTIGERERKKHETINRLAAEGIVDMNKSLLLPTVPQNVAVLSSETAAGYGDFMHQLKHNAYGYAVRAQLFNAAMQGDKAVESIIQALMRIYDQEERFDIVVLIRGGGAQTDLDCFDDYDLCAHLAQFPLPIITGIGHERDNTIADMVANTRMKTPTAAAEFIISGFSDYEAQLDNLFDQIKTLSKAQLQQNNEYLNQMTYQLGIRVQKRLHESRVELSNMERSIQSLPARLIERHWSRIHLLEKSVETSNPHKILNRGFSITKINGRYAKNNHDVKTGDLVESVLKAGKIESIVK